MIKPPGKPGIETHLLFAQNQKGHLWEALRALWVELCMSTFWNLIQRRFAPPPSPPSEEPLKWEVHLTLSPPEERL